VNAVTANTVTTGTSYVYVAAGTERSVVTATGGTETRGKNKNTMFIIKW
jgi:hypothetical protein